MRMADSLLRVRLWRTYAVKCCITSTETVGLSGTGAQDGHLDFHTAPELCTHARPVDVVVQCWLSAGSA